MNKMTTSYLSRVEINRDAPIGALLPILNPYCKDAAMEAHHRLIWSLFSSGNGKTRDFLWRAAGNSKFYILSARRPEQNILFCNLDCKPFSPNLQEGDNLFFSLRANVTKDLSAKEAKKRGQRVDVVINALHKQKDKPRAAIRLETAQKEAIAWLDRIGKNNGFIVDHKETHVEDYSVRKIRRHGDKKHTTATFGIMDIKGKFELTEPKKFIFALQKGFGRAKAFGCGLMLIRR